MVKNIKLLPQRTPRAQSGTCCAPSVLSVSSMVHPFRLPPSAFRLRRSAMSLIEVLISMFVLLFGLMGVAAIFPVGNYYVVEAEKFDLASGIAQNAFEELRARGRLKPEAWYYGSLPPNGTVSGNQHFIQPAAKTSQMFFNITSADGPGHAFVIDPLGNAEVNQLRFPFQAISVSPDNNPWLSPPSPLLGITGELWPVRRLTVLDATGLMKKDVAETIFRLRDDLAVEQPKESDVPSIQRWDIDATTNALLRRQYKGDYSWLATIVPTTGAGLAALQPSNADYGEIGYDVSIVVFRKREETPSAASERLIQAELLQGGELVLYSSLTNALDAKNEVDVALEGIRSGNWISLLGVNQTTGDFVMKWYRLLALDEETELIRVESLNADYQGRRAMLIGPDWPMKGAAVSPNLRAAILPGVISVVTKPLRMEHTSLWNLE